MKKFITNPFNLLLVALIFLNILPWLAPVFLQLGWEKPAKAIYFVYSFFCHQLAWRSLHIYNHQCAWCARDTAIWGAFLAVALLVKFKGLKGFKWYWMIPFAIPMAMDGGIQTVATLGGFLKNDFLYVSTNLLRTLTGAIFGTGLGMTMLPYLRKTSDEEQTEK